MSFILLILASLLSHEKIVRDITSADNIEDRTIVFTLISGLCLGLKWGTIDDDENSSFEQELIDRFIIEAEAHGDATHISRALALKEILFARLGSYKRAILCHHDLERLYDPITFPKPISQSYGSDRAGQTFGLCAQWYDLEGDKGSALRCVDYVITHILPNQDERNTHNMFMILFPILWVMKRYKRSLQAQKLWDIYVVKMFYQYHGDGASTWCDKFFKIVSLLLELSALEEDEAYIKANSSSFQMNDNVMYILESSFLKFTNDSERLISMGRDGRSIIAEICFRLAMKASKVKVEVEAAEVLTGIPTSLRKELVDKGLSFAAQSLNYLNNEEASRRSVSYTLLQVTPLYEILQSEHRVMNE